MFASVVIPVYNKASTLEAAVDSVLQQAGDDFEIILVDDGSTDGAVNLYASHPRVRTIKQFNQGVSAARNHGIDFARGDWVFFLDADDIWMLGHLEKFRSAIAGNPGGEFFASSYVRMSSGDLATAVGPMDCSKRRVDPRLLDAGSFFRRWKKGPFFFTSSVCVSRERLNSNRPCFPVGENLGEDQDLWFRIISQVNLTYIDVETVVYRVGDTSSLSGLRGPRRPLPFQLRLSKCIQDKSVPSAARGAILHYLRREYIRCALRSVKAADFASMVVSIALLRRLF